MSEQIPMTEQRAREILGYRISDDGRLWDVDGSRLFWVPGDIRASIDDYLSADQLEAIAWWMRNKP